MRSRVLISTDLRVANMARLFIRSTAYLAAAVVCVVGDASSACTAPCSKRSAASSQSFAVSRLLTRRWTQPPLARSVLLIPPPHSIVRRIAWGLVQGCHRAGAPQMARQGAEMARHGVATPRWLLPTCPPPTMRPGGAQRPRNLFLPNLGALVSALWLS